VQSYPSKERPYARFVLASVGGGPGGGSTSGRLQLTLNDSIGRPHVDQVMRELQRATAPGLAGSRLRSERVGGWRGPGPGPPVRSSGPVARGHARCGDRSRSASQRETSKQET
jgi:hypothetical protein